MPITLPTPAEISAAPWHARDRAIGRARALVAAYAQAVEPAKPYRRTRMTKRAKAQRDRAYGHAVREEARRLLDAMGIDPDWQAHQAIVVEAVR